MIPFDPELAKALAGHYSGTEAVRDSIVDALFLAQVRYWTAKGANQHDGHAWVYNARAAWAHQLGSTDWGIRKTIERLTNLGVLVAIHNPHSNLDRKPWLRIDEDRCAALDLPLVTHHQSKGSSIGDPSPMDRRTVTNGLVNGHQSIGDPSPSNNRRLQQKTNQHETTPVQRASGDMTGQLIALGNRNR